MEKNTGKYWQRQLELAFGNNLYKKWRKQTHNIVKRYRNERFQNNKNSEQLDANEDTGYNLLYRNVAVRLPFILPYIPKVQVDRTNRDNDQTGRVASMILERITSKIVDDSGFKNVLSYCKLDAELANMGIIWVSYAPEFTDETVREDIQFDFVSHADFVWQKSKCWDDCEWVARKNRLTAEDFKAHFPDMPEAFVSADDMDKLTQNFMIDSDDQSEETTTVYEIWDKKSHMVYFYQPSSNRLLDIQDYPYDIEFPCARPLSYDEFTDSTVPVSRHAQYLSQYKAVDSINRRITNVKNALRIAGAYDASVADFGKIFDNDNDTKLIGLKNVEKYQGKPISDMMWIYDPALAANALVALKTTRDEYISDIQKGLGIYDIMEGESQTQDGYGSNKLKGSFGTMRLQDDQKDAIYFVQDTIRIACDIICQVFEPLSIVQYSTMEYSLDSIQSLMEAVDLLKTKALKDTRLTISLEDVRSYYDSDYKANISELWGQVFTQLNVSSTMIQQIPEMASICKVALMSMVRAYKVGAFVEQQIEEAIDNAIASYQERMKQPPEPTPEMIKAQNEQKKLALEEQKLQIETQKSIAELQKDGINDQIGHELDNKRIEAETAKIISDRQINEEDLAIRHRTEDRKDRELDAEIELAIFSALNPEVAVDTNLGATN